MKRQHFDYDLVIIGGGSAGIVAGNVAGGLGARVALAEKSRLGGECLWTGCVPSKALLHVAGVAKTMRRGKSLGLKNVRLSRDDCAGAFAYVREKIEEVRVNDATEKMLRDFGVEILLGTPQFVGPHLVTTPGGDLRAAKYLIATGSSPAVPDIPGLAEAGYRDNTTLFDLDHVPESLAVIGGGYIACEMGQALARLGASVTLIERGPRLLSREDGELTALLTESLAADGVRVLTDATITEVVRGDENGTKTIRCERNGETVEVVCEEILVATGRKPNTDGLGLSAAGVECDEDGNVIVNAAGRTTAPHIWACGDVTGKYPFSHMAEHEAKIVVRNLLFPGSQDIPFDVAPYAVFTDPELAQVGLTEQQAVEKHGADAVQVLRHRFFQDDRAIVEGHTTGMVKVITTGINGNVVGASILGPSAGDLIHEWVIALRHGLPVRAIADLIHVYPTVSVSNQRAAQRWYTGVLEKPAVKGTLRTLFGLDPKDAGSL